MITAFDFNGAGAVLTGAGNGIGRATALEFARRGARVLVSDIDEDAAAAVAAEIRADGGTALHRRVDVTDAESVSGLADVAFEQFGEVRILMNNAGVTWRPYRAIWNAQLNDFRWIMEVNYFGVVHGVLAFIDRMRAQDGRKHMINTSSVGALLGTPGHAPYTASKHAVDGLSEVLRSELEDHGDDFGVTVLYPGAIATNIAETSRASRAQHGVAGSDDEVIPYVHVRDRAARSWGAPSKPAETVALQVVDAIIHNDPLCLTHPADEPAMQSHDDALRRAYRGL